MKSPMGYGFVPWEGMFFISPQGTRGRSYSAPPMGRVDLEERFQGVKLRMKILVFFDKDQYHAVFLQIRYNIRGLFSAGNSWKN